MSKLTNNDNRRSNRSNNRRDFLKQGVTAAAAFGIVGLGLRTQPSLLANPLTRLPLQDKPRTHNMLVVGEESVYLSHLPMFDGVNKKRTDFTSPHRYQVILEATFADGTTNLTETYTADRRSNPTEKMYTINPSLFVLPDLDPKGKALLSFRGNTVYRGHLERENTPLFGFMEPPPAEPPAGGMFDVNVTRVVHFHKFAPGAAKPAQLQYILFGKGTETFMAHFIAGPPDFDQVIAVKVIGPMFADDQLAGGITVNFPGKLNTGKTRLKEKDKASGVFKLGTAKSTPLQVEVMKEFYFEEGELRIPPTFDPTVEEKKSDFGE